MWYVLELREQAEASMQAFRRAVKICGVFHFGLRSAGFGGGTRVFVTVCCEPAELLRLRVQYGRPLLVHGMAVELPAVDVAVA